MASKIKWKVEPASKVYAYRTSRPWPSAQYDGALEYPAGYLTSATSYSIEVARNASHQPLTLWVADHSVKPWKWRRLKAEFPNIQAAKAALLKFVNANRHFQPKEIRDACDLPERWESKIPKLRSASRNNAHRQDA